MNEVLGQINPFANDNDAEEEIPDEPENFAEDLEHEPSKTVQALKYLAEAGLPLSKLLDDVLLGNKTIRGNYPVMGVRTEMLKSSVISRTSSRICTPQAGMRLRDKARTAAKDKIEAWAIDTTKHTLIKKLVTYTEITKAPITETKVISEESLSEMTFGEQSERFETHTPRLYKLLSKHAL
jgi:hypothetical protein